MSPQTMETECLILGSGIAGLSAAIALSDRGIHTTVVTSAPKLAESNTFFAQGGILFEGPSDPSKLVEDIIEAGAGINYRPAVDQLAQRGPELVQSLLLDRAQVPFDRTKEGKYHLTREAAHSVPRILHQGDESGKALEESLLALCQEQKHITMVTHTTAVNLLMSSFHALDTSVRYAPAQCLGAFLYDQKTKQVYAVHAKNTILATGGLGQLYLHNTNSKYARGDGTALAHRAGCRLENLEYIQFHPTTFFHSKSKRFLISEALRGEGAILINGSGERFLPKYLKNYATPELAPRDKLAKAIHQEMLSTGAPCVYLDIRHRPAEWIQERFPFVYRNCLAYEIDLTQDPIPVVPAAHYHCGGVWTDLHGRTSVPRLWAVGETACTGVHGANRLASTSLLEGLVWGTAAGEQAAHETKTLEYPRYPQMAPWQYESEEVDSSFLSQDWLTLKHTMWNYVGLIKTDARLKRAEGILTELARGIDVFYRKARLSDALIGLRHAAHVALLALQASQRNKRSLGCYLREEREI